MFCGYYSDKDLASFLEEMIEGTKRWLIIVSPFVRISGRIKGYLEKLLLRRVKIILVYKTNYDKVENIKKEDYEWLIKNNIQVRSSRNLHAKCYINEKYALVTSINLVDYSIANNFEMGTAFSNENWSGCDYMWILNDVLKINCDGSKIDFNYYKNNYDRGFCIRTGVEIPFNIDKPMCDEVWNEWCEIGDPNIPENYCHYSGEKSNGETSVKYPIKYEYYREACDEYKIDVLNRDKSMWWGKGKKSL